MTRQNKVPLTIEQNRFLILEAIVNENVKCTFVLDTGAGLEVVSRRFFDRIKDTALPVGIASGFQSIGTRVELELYRIPSMQIGEITRKNVMIAPYSGLDGFEPIDGLVSLKFFDKHPFTLDFVSRHIVLESEESLKSIQESAETIPLLEQRDRDVSLSVYVPLVLNEQVKIQAEFDTGTGVETMVNPYYLSALGIDVESPDVQTTEFINPDGKSQEMVQASITSIALAHSQLVKVTDVQVTFLNNFIYEGLVGWQLFRHFLVTIDLPNLRLLIRKNPVYSPAPTPQVLSSYPVNGAVGVPIDIDKITVEFSTDMSSAICIGVPGAEMGVSYENAYWKTKRILAITIPNGLKSNHTYELYLGIPNVCQMMSDTGVSLPLRTWSFTTA
jgi:hypothetical protein